MRTEISPLLPRSSPEQLETVPRQNAKPSDENNAFDLLRLSLALLVVYTHANLLGGFGEEGFFRFTKLQTEAGSLAVLGFFGISGFLVTRSIVLRNDWRAFLKSRALRILPGFYFALATTAFVLAPILSLLNPQSGGWQASAAEHFILKNAFLKVGEWNVGRVLAGLPYEGSINGALWSLFPEACCYGLILLLSLLSTTQNRRLHVLFAGGILALFHTSIVLAPERTLIAPTFLQLSGWDAYFLAFFVGSLIFLFRDELSLGRKGALLSGTGVVLLLKLGGWKLLGPILLPFAAIHLAYSFRLRLPVDVSYGLYIMHFPLLHVFSALGINRWGFAPYLSITLLATVVLAIFSWFAVEKPALYFKQRKGHG